MAYPHRIFPFILIFFAHDAIDGAYNAPVRWVEAVFSLVWAVVSVQPGAAAMTECGLIPALLNVVQLNMDGQVKQLLGIFAYVSAVVYPHLYLIARSQVSASSL